MPTKQPGELGEELVAGDGVLPRLGGLEVERRAAELLSRLRLTPSSCDLLVEGGDPDR